MAYVPNSHLIAMPKEKNQIVSKGHHAPTRTLTVNRIPLGQDDEKFTLIDQRVQKMIGDITAAAFFDDIDAYRFKIAQAARRITELHAKPSRRRASFASIPSPRAYSASDSARA